MARWAAAVLALATVACGELSGPRGTTASLSIVPVFDAAGAFADNADQLRIIIRRVGATDTVTIKDTVLSIDTTGTASGNLSVVILTSPQEFLVTLSAVRSSDGVVLFSGTTSVSVTSTGGGTVPPPVQIPVTYSGPKGTAVVIAPRDTVVAAGGTFVLRATVFGTSGIVAAPVTFSLVTPADSTTLKVNHLTGVAVAAAGASGTVKVFAASPDNLRDTTTVTVGSVSAPVASVAVTPATATIVVGGTQQLAAVLKDAGNNTLTGRTVTWSSADNTLATVGGTGLVTGVAPGTVVVTATSEGKSGTATITVSLVPVASVTVTPATPTITIGGTQQMTAVLRDAANNVLTGRTVTWVSSLPGIAQVNTSGLVTAIAAGTATITATSGGVNGTTTVTVIPLAAGVKVSPGLAAVAAGSTTPLSGVVVDAGGNTIPVLPVTWTSRAVAVATVNAGTGVVTGVVAGTTVIVGQGSGFSDSTLIVVPPTGNVVASTTAGTGRAFQVHKVGDVVTVVLTADMRFTPTEKLGSYGDTLTWNPAVLQFIDVVGGPVFAAPTVNTIDVASGRLILAGIDPTSNTSGQVVMAVVHFTAIAAGSTSPTLGFNEMSGQVVGGTSTVLFSSTINRITVVNGKITVIP